MSNPDAGAREALTMASDDSYVAPCGKNCRLHFWDGKPQKVIMPSIKNHGPREAVAGFAAPHIHHGDGCKLAPVPAPATDAHYEAQVREWKEKAIGLECGLIEMTKARDSAVKDVIALRQRLTAAEEARDDAIRVEVTMRKTLDIVAVNLLAIEEQHDALTQRLTEANGLLASTQWVEANDDWYVCSDTCGAAHSRDAGNKSTWEHYEGCRLAAHLAKEAK